MAVIEGINDYQVDKMNWLVSKLDLAEKIKSAVMLVKAGSSPGGPHDLEVQRLLKREKKTKAAVVGRQGPPADSTI